MFSVIHNVNKGHGLVGKQSGGGTSFHRGVKYQKGAGLGALLMKAVGWAVPHITSKVIPWVKGLFGYAKPIISSVAKAGADILTSKPVKEIAQETAVKATVDLLSGKNPKDTIKEVKKTLKKAGTNVIQSKALKETLKKAVNTTAHNIIFNKPQQSTKHIADIKEDILKAISGKAHTNPTKRKKKKKIKEEKEVKRFKKTNQNYNKRKRRDFLD